MVLILDIWLIWHIWDLILYSLTQQHPSRLTFSHLPGRVANPFTPDASRTKTFGKRWTVEAPMPRCPGWRGFNMNEHGRWGREKNKSSKFGTFINCFVSRFHGIFGVLYFIFKGRELQGMVDVYHCWVSWVCRLEFNKLHPFFVIWGLRLPDFGMTLGPVYLHAFSWP